MQGAAGILPTRHVAVAVYPLNSHPSAMLDLVRGIAASAPQGTVFSFFKTEASNDKLFGEASAHGKVRRCDVDYDLTGVAGSPVPVPEVVASYQRLAPKRLLSEVRRAEEEVGCNVGCLLTDSFVWSAGEMAEEMGVRGWLLGRLALLCFSSCSRLIPSARSSEPRDLKKIRDSRDSPPSLVDLYSCILWLDGQKPASVVYISFGTEAMLASDEIRELAGALEETGYPYLWSNKGEVGGNRILEGFKERTRSHGKIVPWTSQLEVLKNRSVGVFVTHCGWKSLLESAASGVVGPKIMTRRAGELVLSPS